ncbi:MAG: polyhydroxyalkanoate synthesis regulator phasin [Parvicellaceae bacterium]|jgi:polyhydroxyalkanoate synthesis regulator phasin
MDLLKNFIYAGVGLASTTSDKLKETIDDLVEKGKISDTEGKRICDDFFKSTGEKKEDFELKLKKVQEDLSGKFDFLKKSKKDDDAIDALNKKIEELEAKLARAETKTAAPKAAPKKKTAVKKPAAKKTTKK